jgi:hypothetical protein
VHAIAGQAYGVYVALGFEPSPPESMTLMVTLSDVRANFTQADQGAPLQTGLSC